MSQMGVIETRDLTKAYNGFVAVDKLSLGVDEGEVFGFLGPNGAGKTTTILMLLGLAEPTSGTARVCGYDCTREALKVKRLAGYLPEKLGFYEDLTARQNLDYTAELNGLSRGEAQSKIRQTLETVGLSEVAEQKVGEFSHGMKQRLGIADVMVKEPRVAFLDEPTAGIDPQGIEQVLGIITGMARRNVTVVLSSHQLHQVQRVCSQVGILSRGRLVVQGPMDRLGRDALGGGKYRIELQVSEPTSKLVSSLEGIRGVTNVEKTNDVFLVSCEEDVRPQVARAVVDSDSLLVQMKIEEYGLEQIYMKYFHEG